jgi:photosystem II stability/assembly factor-like uncharacterized protein
MLKWTKLPGVDAPVYTIGRSATGEWLVGTHDGIWRWEGGALLRAGLPGVPITAVAAIHDSWLVGAPDGIAISNDRGTTWQVVSNAIQQISQIALLRAFQPQGVIYASALEGGVFRSIDMGASWEECNGRNRLGGTFALAMLPNTSTGPYVLASTDAGIFRSMDGGNVWVQTELPESANPVISFSESYNRIWANSEDDGLWCSTDEGVSWQRARGVPEDCVSMVASPDSHHLIGVGDAGFYLSRYGGSDWTVCPSPFPPDALSAVELDHRFALCSRQSGGVWAAALYT